MAFRAILLGLLAAPLLVLPASEPAFAAKKKKPAAKPAAQMTVIPGPCNDRTCGPLGNVVNTAVLPVTILTKKR